jgi:hypothetical protein
MNKKWLAPILPYLAIWAGLFLFQNAWVALIGFHFALLFALAVARPNIPVGVLFKSKHPKWIFASALFCGSSGIVLYFFWDLFGVADNLRAQLEAIGLNSSSWFAFSVYFSLVNPFIEEYFWRAYLGSDAKELRASDFAYAGYHALILWRKTHPLAVAFAVVTLVLVGWFWRQVRREDEGLLASALGHLAADFTIMTCVYLRM